MKRTFCFVNSFGTAVLVLASSFNATQTLAEAPCSPSVNKSVACRCGQWTCPSCQQESNCTPACPPGSSSTPSMSSGTPDASDQNVLQTPPTVTPAPEQSASQSAADLTANMDSSQFNPQSRGSTNQLASRGSDNTSSAVEFLGDNFGSASGESLVSEIFFDGSDAIAISDDVRIPSSVTGRMKLAENASPIPRDRIFFNYSLFNNVPLTPQGITVNRFTPGFEKTFFGKLASVEFRAPFASTLDSNIYTDGTTSTSNVEFGNLFFTFKGLLLATDTWAISGGTSLSLPTADDNRVFASGDFEVARIRNQAVHILPFLGGVYAPSSRFYTHGILQVDVATGGNDVEIQTLDGNLQDAMVNIGKFNDSTVLYSSIGMGYWLVKRGPRDRSFIRGIIPTLEAHWNRSLNDADCVTFTDSAISPDPIALIQPVIKEIDVLNMVGGCTFQLRNNSRLAFGYAAPLGNSQDRVFDGEWRATWNKLY